MILLTGGVPAPRGVWPGGVSAPGGVPGGDPPGMATAAGGTHPTGMHSCVFLCLQPLQTQNRNFQQISDNFCFKYKFDEKLFKSDICQPLAIYFELAIW